MPRRVYYLRSTSHPFSAGPMGGPELYQRRFEANFAFTIRGRNLTVGEFAMIGRFTTDGNGRFDGSGDESVNGHVGHSTFAGTCLVEADCAGSSMLNFADGVKGGLKFRSIATRLQGKHRRERLRQETVQETKMVSFENVDVT